MAEFEFGAQPAPVVADLGIGVPALLVVHDDRVVGVHVDVGIARKNYAGIDAEIALAVASVSRNGYRARRNAEGQRGPAQAAETILHWVYPHPDCPLAIEAAVAPIPADGPRGIRVRGTTRSRNEHIKSRPSRMFQHSD